MTRIASARNAQDYRPMFVWGDSSALKAAPVFRVCFAAATLLTTILPLSLPPELIDGDVEPPSLLARPISLPNNHHLPRPPPIMGAAVHLPDHIWFQIVQYLPALAVRDLYSVNSALFNIAMNVRYRQMSFAYLDNRMIRNLVRLKDPEVAKRVKVLHVYPGFLQETFDREKATPPLQRTLRYCLTDIANHLREQKLLPKNLNLSKLGLIRTLRRPEDMIRLMLDVLGALPNVSDYYVTWCGLPGLGPSAASILSTVFHSDVRKLSLDISLENVQSLTQSMWLIRHLEELHLCIHYDYTDALTSREEIFRKHVAPAINHHRKTLKRLLLQSWEPRDMSQLFYAIEHLPALDMLSVSIPVESPHLGNPEGLTNFLNRHSSTLKSLRLRATQFGGAGLNPDPISFDYWIQNALKGVTLHKLRTLDISSGLFPVETALSCLTHFSRSLTTVCITGHYRSYEDVEEILDILQRVPRERSLEKLRLGSVSLSPQLLDLLAASLPSLRTLELVVRDLLPHALDVPLYFRGGHIRAFDETQTVDFFTEMKTHKYPYWHLRRMSLVVDALPSRTYYEQRLEKLFRTCIPSITTFT
ncbi:hypothetical protein BDQ12DRAFT_669709 [Crucibulum laeve]|uniref:F-box domain-containing protein n=1 Tax=Crucibulum laeve TaxID=68775 RepID=A0A5C3LNV8_9AGAR|nr:hypothetical protein BDQ12DRAFT_669709 [Crucibulum laeve]